MERVVRGHKVCKRSVPQPCIGSKTVCTHRPMCASRLAHAGVPWRRGRSSRLAVSANQVFAAHLTTAPPSSRARRPVPPPGSGNMILESGLRMSPHPSVLETPHSTEGRTFRRDSSGCARSQSSSTCARVAIRGACAGSCCMPSTTRIACAKDIAQSDVGGSGSLQKSHRNRSEASTVGCRRRGTPAPHGDWDACRRVRVGGQLDGAV